jgi:hypothetical protein
MKFRSLQYLRISAVLLIMTLLACVANAQTAEIGQGCNCKGDQPGVEFNPLNDELSSKTSAENNKDCNTLSVIEGNTKIPTDYYVRSLTYCVTSQSQPTKNPQDQTTSNPPKKDNPAKINIFTGIGHVSKDAYKPLTGKERWHLYLNQTFIPPEAYFGVLWSSLVDHIDHDPPEWGQGMAGYGLRLASRFGTNVVQNSILAVGAVTLHEEPRYINSSSKGFFHRSGHALLFTVVTYNNSGKMTPAIASVGSIYAASMITTLWMPQRYTVLGDGVRDGNLQLAFGGMFNLIEEFWPEIKKAFKR